jgi:transposase
MKEITTVGVDLAKDVIMVCAADRSGRPALVRKFSRHGFGEWAATLAPCTFGMEACSSAHHWGRWLTERGHRVRLMAAEFVTPFRKSKGAKNDRNDAEAIVEAMSRPSMRFVAVKAVDQQAILAWHRMRAGWNEERTALINRVRGLLAEFGVWLPRSAQALIRALPRLIQDDSLPARLRALLTLAEEQLRLLDERIDQCAIEIREHAKQSEDARRISAITGIGPITASAVLATVPHARDFKNGQMAAWMGLTPRQHSSGGKERLGVITKRGDTYLRGLLTQGARSTLQAALIKAPDKLTRLESWIVALHARVGYHKTLVAIANKHARMIWALLTKGEAYDPAAWQRYVPSIN